MFLALIFETGTDYSQAMEVLNPKSVISVNGRTFLTLEVEEKELRKGFTVPKEFKEFVKLVVVPETPVIDTFGRQIVLNFSGYVDQKCFPLVVEFGSDNWLKSYIIVEPDTDFYLINIIAAKEEKKIGKITNRCHFSFEVDDEDSIFYICGSKAKEKCFQVECFDKEIMRWFKNYKKK